MSLSCGIVGMPNVGKSTLFNALTHANAAAANYPFCTIDPNVGVVAVPDARLDRLVELYHPKRNVPAQVQFVDIAGLVKGASQGEGLGNQFLSHIRECQAIVEVVRCFDKKDVVHVAGSIDPQRDVEIIETELLLKDLDSVTKSLDKAAKQAKSQDKTVLFQLAVLKKAKDALDQGRSLRFVTWDEEETKFLNSLALLTHKPLLYVANVDEAGLKQESGHTQALKDLAAKQHIPVVVLCCQLEAELLALPQEEQAEFLASLGLKEPGLNALIRAGYELLGLQTFLTGGPDETRAWTFEKGMKAPQCAGVIHTDFERGFIRAEVFSFNELDKLGSELAVREKGLLRSEGKDYVMQDGDVVHFRFNV